MLITQYKKPEHNDTSPMGTYGSFSVYCDTHKQARGLIYWILQFTPGMFSFKFMYNSLKVTIYSQLDDNAINLRNAIVSKVFDPGDNVAELF